MTDDRLIPRRAVLARLGVGRTTLYRWMDESGFPRAVAVGPRAVRWLESEVDAWIAARPRVRGVDDTPATPAA